VVRVYDLREVAALLLEKENLVLIFAMNILFLGSPTK
jgi:hypothetical protein